MVAETLWALIIVFATWLRDLARDILSRVVIRHPSGRIQLNQVIIGRYRPRHRKQMPGGAGNLR